MSTTEAKEPKLSINDPIPPDVLNRLTTLLNNSRELEGRLMALEHEKVRILVVSQKTEEERMRLFARELVSRGLTPDTPVEVDGKTGKIVVLPPSDPQAP